LPIDFVTLFHTGSISDVMYFLDLDFKIKIDILAMLQHSR